MSDNDYCPRCLDWQRLGLSSYCPACEPSRFETPMTQADWDTHESWDRLRTEANHKRK